MPKPTQISSADRLGNSTTKSARRSSPSVEANCDNCGIVDPRGYLWRLLNDRNWAPLSVGLLTQPPVSLHELEGWESVLTLDWLRSGGDYTQTHVVGISVWGRDDYSVSQASIKVMAALACDCSSSLSYGYRGATPIKGGFWVALFTVQLSIG